MLIYKITNSKNSKVYIGKTIYTLKRRWKGHKVAAKKGSETYLHKAIRKYGAAAFVPEIIKGGVRSEANLNRFERKFIKLYKSNNPDFGYNQTSGGELTGHGNPNWNKHGPAHHWWGRRHTRTERIKITKGIQQAWDAFYHAKREQHRKNVSAGMLQKQTAEQRRAIARHAAHVQSRRHIQACEQRYPWYRKEVLERYYIQRRWLVSKIAEKFGVTDGQIYGQIRRHALHLKISKEERHRRSSKAQLGKRLSKVHRESISRGVRLAFA